MKTLVKFNETLFPPLLQLSIYRCPHKRQQRVMFQKLRDELNAAATEAGIHFPIEDPVDIRIIFIDPTSPDLDHVLEVVYTALDGKSLKGPALLKSDSQIQAVHMMKFYPNGLTKRDGPQN